MAFDLSQARGLSGEEAAARLVRDGPNELASEKKPGLVRTIFKILQEPMLLLLLAAGALYLILGDTKEALTLSSFVIIVISITIIQERRTENALAALRDLSSPRASVIRDGKLLKIPGREVVRGDIILLQEGDRVPADAWLQGCEHIEVDESLLTGESVAVRKKPAPTQPKTAQPGGDDLPFVYSGTLITRGRGLAEVLATGADTELGKIGKMLTHVGEHKTALQREVGRIVRIVAAVGLSICVVVVLLLGLSRGDWLKSALSGIALAMAVLPEEFPVVLTVFLALGAWRISKLKVLTRKLPAIEALGKATILCTDKTGTLTENKMTLAHLWSPQGEHQVDTSPLPEEVHEVVEFGILASQRDPFDPMEIAFKSLGERALSGTEHLHAGWSLVREYPLSHALLSMSHVWRAPEGTRYVIAAKGAPEAIIDLCHLSKEEEAKVQAQVAKMAKQGLRVLGVARAYFGGEPLPREQHDFDFSLVGLAGMLDPVRESVPQALEECAEAGVRVMMITGDSPETAKAIARSAKLPNPDAAITGQELEETPSEKRVALLRKASIVARAVPAHKLKIVQALRSDGEVVAMTGDGVNDAPALKAAHIGVAMGKRGTDVAREAASLVLTDDNFASIVAAVRMGRRIFENLRKAMGYIIAVHIPIIGLSLASALFGWPLVLFPVHIVTLELIIDPSCSIVFEAEPEEPNTMKRPPHRVGAPLFSPRVLALSVLQGFGLLVAVLWVFGWAWGANYPEESARALAFSTLITGNIALLLTNRSWQRSALKSLSSHNPALWMVVTGAAIFLSVSLSVPFFRGIFGFSGVGVRDFVFAALLGMAGVLWFELYKLASKRSKTRKE